MNQNYTIEQIDLDTMDKTIYGSWQTDGTYKIEFIDQLPNDTLSCIAIQQIKTLDFKVLETLETSTNFITLYTDKGIKTLEFSRVPTVEKNNVILIESIAKEFTLSKSDTLSRTKLETAVIDITEEFVHIDSSNFDDVIHFSIEAIARAIDADYSYIFMYDFATNLMRNTYEWVREGFPSKKEAQQDIPITKFLDGWVNEHLQGKSVIVENVQELHSESNLHKVLEPQNIKSQYTLPLYDKDQCIGFLGFDTVNDYQTWNSISSLIKAIPVLIAGILGRKDDIYAIQEAKLKLEHSQNNINEFLAKLNHEIKTPLVGLVSAVEMLRETNLTSEQLDLIETVDYSSESLGNLVGNISSEFRGGADEPTLKDTTFDLEEEVVKLIGLNKQLANSKKLGLYLTYDYSLPKLVTCDKSKLRQILNNLIQNAIRYTNYGHVELRVSKVESNAPFVDVKFEISDTGIGISKENIDKLFNSYYREKHQTLGKPTGTGLGLNIANNMVELMGGKIEVDTEKFAGSTFHFTLKLYAQVVEETTKSERALLVDITMNYHSNIKDLLAKKHEEVIYCNYEMDSIDVHEKFDVVYIHTNDEENYLSVEDELLIILNELPGSPLYILLYDNAKKAAYIEAYPLYDSVKEVPCTFQSLIMDSAVENKIKTIPIKKSSNRYRVLLVEDNNINRKIMVKLLSSLNLEVTEAVDGFDALDIVMEKQFDLIFMDVLMPGMNGYETTKRIRALESENSSVPIFAVSANDLEKTEVEGMEYGINGALEKPLNTKVVSQLLERIFTIGDSSLFDRYPLFDSSTFESMYDSELGREIIDTFMDEFDSDFKRVKDAFDSKDNVEIHKAIHYMKGTFTYIGAERLTRFSQKVLQLSDDGHFDEILHYEELYFNYLNQLKKELETYKKEDQ